MFGPLPRHAQAAEGHTNGFVADQPRGETLGKTHLGGQRQRPPAGGLAERAWTLVQQRPQGLADPRGENRRRGMWARREGLQHREAALMKRMKGVADSLIGAAQLSRNRGRRVPLGTGEEDLAAAHRTGGRGPETGLQDGPLVRRERAYK